MQFERDRPRRRHRLVGLGQRLLVALPIAARSSAAAACGLMNQDRPRRAVRTTAGSALAAIQIGGYGFCTGRIVQVASCTRKKLALDGHDLLGP